MKVHVTPVGDAGLLDAAYLADQGEPVERLSPFLRAKLADHLGCDADLYEEVWSA